MLFFVSKILYNKLLYNAIYYYLLLYLNMKYKISEYATLKRVTYRTVWNWVKKGIVKIEKSPSGGILIIEDE